MSEIVPKGYSANCYPSKFIEATHSISAEGSIPVYTKYFEDSYQPSPSADGSFLKTFLSSGDQVIVLDEHVGPRGHWAEIMLVNDSSATNYNLFIYNNKERPVLQPLPFIKPTQNTVENIQTRDYNSPIFSYDNRQSNVVFYDPVFKHYVVKIIQPLNSNLSINKMLEDSIVDGAKLICSEYSVSLPFYTYEYLAEQFRDFFSVFHYTIDIRGQRDVNLTSLVSFITVKSKYLDKLLPNLSPTTEEIAAQEPQYRTLSGTGTRVNEYVDVWLDPARSPVDAESFFEQYSENFQDQIKSDYNFRKNWEDLKSRGTKTPSNIVDILAEELSETPVVGKKWLENQSDQARAEQAVAKQDLERAISNAIDKMFAYLKMSPASTRRARNEIRNFTAGAVALGATVEDINDMINGVTTALNNTPDVFNLETGEFNVSPIEIISVMGEELGLLDEFPELSDPPDPQQAIKTIAESFKQPNQLTFSRFFEDIEGPPLDDTVYHKYPVKSGASANKIYTYDNIFSFAQRDAALKELLDYLIELSLDTQKIGTNNIAFYDKKYVGDIAKALSYLFHSKDKQDENEGYYKIPLESLTNKEGVEKHLLANSENLYLRYKRKDDIYSQSPEPILPGLPSFEDDSPRPNAETNDASYQGLKEILAKLENSYNEEEIVYDKTPLLYQVASKITRQSVIEIPRLEFIKDSEEFKYKNDKPSNYVFGNRFSYLNKGMAPFYKQATKSILRHKEEGWKVKGLDEDKPREIQKEVDSIVKNLIQSLVKKNIANLLIGTSSQGKSIFIEGVKISLGFDKDYKIVYAHFSGTLPGYQKYEVFALEGAKNPKYDTAKIISPYSKQAGMHLFYNKQLSNYKNLEKDFKDKYIGISVADVNTYSWREVIQDFFNYPQMEWISPSENPEFLKRSAASRALYQNTVGRTRNQQKAQIREIEKLRGLPEGTLSERENGSGSTTDDIRSGIANLSLPVTRSGENAIDAVFTSTEEFSIELASHIGLDTPVLKPFVKCLIPEIDLEKILKDTEYYKLVKDMQDALLATTESAMAVLDLYDTLEALFTPAEGSGGMQGLFMAVLDKAIDLLILEAFKRALQYIQVLCLKWQAFLMEMITAALLGFPGEGPGDANPSLGQLPGTTGDTAAIGNGVISSLALKGYNKEDIEAVSSPDAMRYVEDLSTLMSPSEFCQLMTSDTSPGYLKDIAFNLYDEFYQETTLSKLGSKEKLYSFLRTMGEFIDPAICEAIARGSRLPVRGYSHTKKQCKDANDIERIKQQIIDGNLQNSGEVRKILDNTAEKNAKDLKTLLVDIESEISGNKKIDLNPSMLFSNIPEVKESKKAFELLKNQDFVSSLNVDAEHYRSKLIESGLDDRPGNKEDLQLGTMGTVYQRFALGRIKNKLKLAFPDYDSSLRRIDRPEYDTGDDEYLERDESKTLKAYLYRILHRQKSGKYVNSSQEIAEEMTESTGIEFSKEDIEVIRIANPRVPIRPFDYVSSATSSGETYTNELDKEGRDKKAFGKYAKQRFLKELKKQYSKLNYKERLEVIEIYKKHKFQCYFGIYDNQGDRNVYYTMDYNWFTHQRSFPSQRVRDYVSTGREEDTYGLSMSDGHRILESDQVTPRTLFKWLKEKFNDQADQFYQRYRDEEGTAKVARAVALHVSPLPPDEFVEVSPISGYDEIDIISRPVQSHNGIEFEIDSSGKFRQLQDMSRSETKIEIDQNIIGVKSNMDGNEYSIYNFDGNKFATASFKGKGGVNKRMSIKLTNNEEEEEKIKDLINLDTRNMVDDYSSNLFSSSANYEERFSQLLHYFIKQHNWSVFSDKDQKNADGEQIFNMLNIVRKNTTKLNASGDYENLLPDIISQNLLGMLSVDKILSEKEELKNKFKSPIEFINQESSLERRDYNTEEKSMLWISIKFFVLTFVADYYLRMLPIIMSSDFFDENQDKISKEMIIKNIEVFLQEDRGQDFEIFKKKFLYYSNVLWLFLKQEKCATIDITDYKDPMSAVRSIVDEFVSNIKDYLKDNELINTSSFKQASGSKIIEVKKPVANPEQWANSAVDTVDNELYLSLAEYVGKQLYGSSLKPVPPKRTKLNQYGNFIEKIKENGILFTNSEIIEEYHNTDTGDIRETNVPLRMLSLKRDPKMIMGLRENEGVFLKYKLRLSLNMLLPENFIDSRNNEWKKIGSDKLEKGIFKDNKKILVLDEITSTDYFIDFQNPFRDGKTLYDSPAMKTINYLNDTDMRIEKEYNKLLGKIKSRPSYERVARVLKNLNNFPESFYLQNMLYYSFYDYYEGLGPRETLNSTRALAINKFLKADARGTKIGDFTLQEIQENEQQEEDSGEETYAAFWKKSINVENTRNLASILSSITSYEENGNKTNTSDPKDHPGTKINQHGRDPFIRDLRKKLSPLPIQYKKAMVDYYKDYKWKPMIGVKDKEGDFNNYVTARRYPYDEPDGAKAHDTEYLKQKGLPGASEGVYAEYGTGHKLTSAQVDHTNIVDWIVESTEDDVRRFINFYKEEEGRAYVTNVLIVSEPVDEVILEKYLARYDNYKET